MSDSSSRPTEDRIGIVTLDRIARTLAFPARVNLRTQVVEYALVTEQGKAYESILTTTAKPTDVQVALLLLGTVACPMEGAATDKELSVPDQSGLRIDVVWQAGGQSNMVRLADLVVVKSEPAATHPPPLAVERWLFNGSRLTSSGFGAQLEGSLISLIRDPVALINNPALDRENDQIHFPNEKLRPPVGTEARIVVHVPPRVASPSAAPAAPR